MNDVVVHVEGVWKRYGLPLVPALRRQWRQWVGRPMSIDEQGPWALRDISVTVRRGDALGIVGRNGAGKSTLLKILAGVTPPNKGRVRVSGRLFPMIELNAGIHPELTGRENTYLLGAIVGLRRRELNARMKTIEEFCELGEWFDRPVRVYSSGMLARLGFSVAVNVDTDILLVDEVLATGDIGFQKKCIDRINEMIARDGTTLLLVSHSPHEVESLCRDGILLDNGVPVFSGPPKELLEQYARTVY